ncbi:MAG: hypothetical protein LBK63_08410 [Treponema sp.]|jgi:hypothetical protein|nr:hypothetical protein [Treponema sp.]
MKLFGKIKKALRLKNKYAVREIKEGSNIRAAVLLSNEERGALSKAERQERFRRWRKEQGL